jgi:hypothetical protein
MDMFSVGLGELEGGAGWAAAVAVAVWLGRSGDWAGTAEFAPWFVRIRSMGVFPVVGFGGLAWGID